MAILCPKVIFLGEPQKVLVIFYSKLAQWAHSKMAEDQPVKKQKLEEATDVVNAAQVDSSATQAFTQQVCGCFCSGMQLRLVCLPDGRLCDCKGAHEGGPNKRAEGGYQHIWCAHTATITCTRKLATNLTRHCLTPSHANLPMFLYSFRNQSKTRVDQVTVPSLLPDLL